MRGRIAVALMVVLATGVMSSAQQVHSSNEPGVVLPAATWQPRPQYTPEALTRRIEGTVMLDCDVMADGTVGAVLVSESLDRSYGLDEQAINALRSWRFRPGTKDGKPVPVRVQVAMRFSLE